jgi:hypothetical protein
MLRPYILVWFLVLCVMVPQWAHGSPPGTIASQVQGATITDSARAKVLAHLARGELAQAIHAYEVATGLKALRLGGKPEYVELTTRVSNKKVDVHIVFRLANGKDARVADAGLHVLVRMNGRAYDAYTGASGVPWAEYMSRLGAQVPIIEKVVESP